MSISPNPPGWRTTPCRLLFNILSAAPLLPSSTSASRSSIRSLVARTQPSRCQTKALCSTLAAPVSICRSTLAAPASICRSTLAAPVSICRSTLAAPASICRSTPHQQHKLSMLCQNRKLTSIYKPITSTLPCAHRSELYLIAHPMSAFRKCVCLVDRSRMAFRKFRERTFDIIDLY